MNEAGKYLIVIGGIVMLLGLILYFWGNSLRWIGHLPGDIRIKRGNFNFYFPLATLIIINLIIFLVSRVWQWLK